MGFYITFLIIGLVLLWITFFVHKHTYVYELEFGEYGERKLTLPRWVKLAAILLSLIPIVNILAFIAGALAWLEHDDIVFKYDDSKLLKWLSKDDW